MATTDLPVTIAGPPLPDEARARVLGAEALAFVAELEARFGARRRELLARRQERQAALDAGDPAARLRFLDETRDVREGAWRVAAAPADLDRRWVEITGPVERKMMINALNSGANGFMADFEDALSPTWTNVVEGQANVMDAVRGTLAYTGPDGRAYRLGERLATLLVRPRGWHLEERHARVRGEPVSASLFDAGLFLFHNAREQMARGTGPYFYLPKLQSHLEARLWNDVFVAAQEWLGVPRGTVRATVLVETLPAAFEMEEILFELREHSAGLNAGRWDYIFSTIKTLRARPDVVLPDRAQVTMTVPFMRAYAERLVAVCHRRGAHAMGGMAAFVPSRRDAEVNARALEKVREDKRREVGQGFDGTWVAHPDLVPVAAEVFAAALGERAHQKDVLGGGDAVTADDLLRLEVPGGRVTREGVRLNVDVALQYLDAWLRGNGAVAIHNLMEDAATAEISRAQLWQWLRHRAVLDDGRPVTREDYEHVRAEELRRLEGAMPAGTPSRLRDAAALLDRLVLTETLPDFLTTQAYALLDGPTRAAASAEAEASTLSGAPRTG